MNLSEITLVVAAGGRSTRMGRDKRFLDLAGESLLARTLRKGRATGFREIILAAEGETEELRAAAARFGARLAVDERPAQGPAAAIAAGLAASSSAWALVLSGDMPFYDFDLVRALLPEVRGERQVVLPTLLGYWQPLAALYRKEAGAAFAAGIARGDRKLGIILRELAVKEVPLTVDAGLFFNVNTPAAYRLALGRIANERRAVPMLSVAAPASGTGKTTFIERLIPRLAAHGIRIAVIKSDAHGFRLDTKGQDTDRFTAAGAAAVAVSAPNGYFIEQETAERRSLTDIAEKLDRASVDVCITEGRTRGVAPLFLLYRGRGTPETDERTIAFFSKAPEAAPLTEDALLRVDLDDLETAERLALFLVGRALYGADGAMFLTM